MRKNQIPERKIQPRNAYKEGQRNSKGGQPQRTIISLVRGEETLKRKTQGPIVGPRGDQEHRGKITCPGKRPRKFRSYHEAGVTSFEVRSRERAGGQTRSISRRRRRKNYISHLPGPPPRGTPRVVYRDGTTPS